MKLSVSRSTPKLEVIVWVIITFDLSGIEDPAITYATAGIPLRIISPTKPHHFCSEYGRN
jgi:hypothetical protein